MERARVQVAELVPPVELAGTPDLSQLDARALQPLIKSYQAKAREAKKALLEYAARVDGLFEKAPSLVQGPVESEGGLQAVVLTEKSRATPAELESFLHVAMAEEGAFARALNRRGPRAAKLDSSYELRTHDGVLIAVLLRDAIPDELAVGWAHMQAVHERRGKLWGLGCEAEQSTNLERTVAAFKTAPGAAAYRIVDRFTVKAIEARGGDTDNKPQVIYDNPDGREITFGIGG